MLVKKINTPVDINLVSETQGISPENEIDFSKFSEGR